MAAEFAETSRAVSGLRVETASIWPPSTAHKCRRHEAVKADWRCCRRGLSSRFILVSHGAWLILFQKNGYEPEALLNFLALMGWDHHTALAALAEAPEGLPPHTRSDAHSLYEVFTVPQLIRVFDINHVNHKKAAVNLSKLDFLNKMTLRRKAGRLGQDGLLANAGKEADDEESHLQRHQLVARLQEILKQHKLYADR